MPHLILEYSKNLADSFDHHAVLFDLHRLLADTGLFKLEDIKSRAVACETFVVGDGAPGRAFAHLEIRILEGRTDAVKAHLSEQGLALLAQRLGPGLDRCQCSVTVEISGIHRTSYKKLSS